jgi:hypothetical protein
MYLPKRRKDSITNSDAKALLRYAITKLLLPVKDVKFKHTNSCGNVYVLIGVDGTEYSEAWFDSNGRPHVKGHNGIKSYGD